MFWLGPQEEVFRAENILPVRFFLASAFVFSHIFCCSFLTFVAHICPRKPCSPLHLLICITHSFHSASSHHLSLRQLFSVWKLIEQAPFLSVFPLHSRPTASFFLSCFKNIRCAQGKALSCFCNSSLALALHPPALNGQSKEGEQVQLKWEIGERKREKGVEGNRKGEEIRGEGGLYYTIYPGLC